MDPAPLTRKDVLLRAWPLVFANAAVPLAGVADTFVLGLRGDASDLAGVALGAAIFNIVYWSVYFLRMGTTGLTAQASGADDEAEVQRTLVRALLLAGVIGLLVWLIRVPLAELGFAILQGGPQAEAQGTAYFTARSWGALPAFGVFALTGWLIGLGRSSETLIVHGVISAVNIGLDLWFVLGLGYGPGGVGAATAIAEGCGLIVALALLWRILPRRGGLTTGLLDRAALLDPGAIRRMIDINLNLMLRTWAMIAGFTWFANAGARQGTVALAGNHVLLQVITVWAFVLDSFAFIAEAESGRAVGRKSIAHMRRTLRLTSEAALGAGVILGGLTLVFGPGVLTAVIGDPAARRAAIDFLPYCAAVPVLGAMAWIFDGIFIGATKGAMLRNASFASVAIYLVADLVLAPPLGNHGVWIAFLVYYIARAGALAAFYPALEKRLA
ncbi:MAG TPA: MATE family efflux transporter [Alphaproteobacteria bacterium]|jgi:MATE family multidrug resistance protein|nr:MATE family efflux transporter [Alphaproteobacteria bacterium]